MFLIKKPYIYIYIYIYIWLLSGSEPRGAVGEAAEAGGGGPPPERALGRSPAGVDYCYYYYTYKYI